jgi:hypothetical protein
VLESEAVLIDSEGQIIINEHWILISNLDPSTYQQAEKKETSKSMFHPTRRKQKERNANFSSSINEEMQGLIKNPISQ